MQCPAKNCLLQQHLTRLGRGRHDVAEAFRMQVYTSTLTAGPANFACLIASGVSLEIPRMCRSEQIRDRVCRNCWFDAVAIHRRGVFHSVVWLGEKVHRQQSVINGCQ